MPSIFGAPATAGLTASYPAGLRSQRQSELDDQAARERAAMQQIADIQSPYQRAQTSALEAQTRQLLAPSRAPSQTLTPQRHGTPYGTVSESAYDQFVLGRANLEQEQAAEQRASARSSETRAAQEAFTREQARMLVIQRLWRR